jgi:hypothetical protein
MARIAYRLIVASLIASTAAAQAPPPRLVTTTGVGEVKVVPDEVAISLGVDVLDKDLAKSRAEGDARIKKSVGAAVAAGVAEKDVQTTAVSIRPEWEYRGPNERVFIGFRTSQTLTIVLRDVAKYEVLLTGLLKAGVERLDGIHWRSSKVEALQADARLIAVRNAREKARALAEALGQSIGPAYMINDEPQFEPVPRMPMYKEMALATPEQGAPIEPGEMTITARVSVGFELMGGR